jgi:hypothetical protein
MGNLHFSVPIVEDALVDALNALNVDGLFVNDGMGGETPVENDCIYIVRTRELDLTPSTRQGGQNEEYDIHLLASAYRPDTVLNVPADADRRAAKTRKWELLDLVRNVLADDDQLGGACRRAEMVKVPDSVTNRTTDGWLSDALAVVHVEARSG